MKPKTKLGKDYQFIVDEINKKQEKFDLEPPFPDKFHRASVSVQVYAKWKVGLDQKIVNLLRPSYFTCAACTYDEEHDAYNCIFYPKRSKKECPVQKFCMALHKDFNLEIAYKPATLIKRKKALLDLAYNIVKKEAKQSNLSIREIPKPHEKG